jgi:hypothetical protein
MAAKKIKIDWSKVDKFLQAQCSGSGIASLLGIHENTLYSRCRTDHHMEFVAYSAKKKGEGKEILKKNLWDIALKGNVSMNIWLSKQYLGFTDKSNINVDFDRMTDEELIFITNELINKAHEN